MPNKPPEPDEIEISVFGPSYGEGIVAKIGTTEWIAVDSCKNEDTGRSKPLEYLESLKVNIGRDVRVVVATHWHRDHIGGLSEFVDSAKSAEFVCPLAFNTKQFMTFAEVFGPGTGNPIIQKSSEFLRTLQILEARGQVPIFVGQDRLLLQTALATQAFTLSPSDTQIAAFLAGIVAEVAKVQADEIVSNADNDDPNHTAIAMLLNLGEGQALLGADLEETRSKGWSTIMAKSSVPRKRIELFKLPHHGSSNAHYQPLWDNEIPKDCWAVLTPFSSGTNPPPTETDVARISAHTSRAFSAARARSTSAVKLEQSTEKLLAAAGIKKGMSRLLLKL